MAKVITLSRQFPSTHPKRGKPTFFVEQFLSSKEVAEDERLKLLLPNEWANYKDTSLYLGRFKKHHTIRIGRRWKTGEMASIRVWSGKPYNSKQILLREVEITVYNVEIEFFGGRMYILLADEKQNPLTGQEMLSVGEVAKNDGLNPIDLWHWFNPKLEDKKFEAQILCWNNKIKY